MLCRRSGPSPHFRHLVDRWGGRSVAAGVCQEEGEQQFGIKDLGSCPHPPLETPLVVNKQLLKAVRIKAKLTLS